MRVQDLVCSGSRQYHEHGKVSYDLVIEGGCFVWMCQSIADAMMCIIPCTPDLALLLEGRSQGTHPYIRLDASAIWLERFSHLLWQLDLVLKQVC